MGRYVRLWDASRVGLLRIPRLSRSIRFLRDSRALLVVLFGQTSWVPTISDNASLEAAVILRHCGFSDDRLGALAAFDAAAFASVLPRVFRVRKVTEPLR